MIEASSVERVPWWVRTFDAIAVAAALLALTVSVTGGFREWTPLGRLSVTSWARPLAVAIIVAVARHWMRPRPILPIQLYSSVRAWWVQSDARSIWATFVATRVGVYVIGFLAISMVGFLNTTPPFRIYENELHNLPARWDTGWYLGVAIEGYHWNPRQMDRQQNIAFFPMYPMLMRYGSLFVARDTLWAGVIISFVSFFFASIYLFKLARQMIGGDAAGFAVALLSAYPFALFYSAAYTESLFLLCAVGACYHFERDELWYAGLYGLVAGLTRPNGCLLSLVLALLAVRPLWASGWRPTWPPPMKLTGLADRFATAALPGIGMLIYSTYIFFLTGNPFQWARQNAAWGRVYRPLDSLLGQHATWIESEGLYAYASGRTLDMLQALAVIFVLVSVWGVFRRLGFAYAMLIIINVLPPLMMGGLLSMGRVTSVLFPTFIWLAAVLPATQRYAWITVFATLQGLCALLFFTWYPLY